MKRALPIALIIAWLAPFEASAQPSTEDRSRARALAIEGHEALERGDYATAEDRYAKADAIVHAPTLLLGLAQAHAAEKKLVMARAEYERVVREGVAAGSPKQWFEALDTAKKELAALQPRIPTLLVRVEGPSSPSVTVDGAAVPAAELGQPRPVDPGDHVVEASAAGFGTQRQSISAGEGERRTVVLTLSASTQGVAPGSKSGSAAQTAPHQHAPFPMKTVGLVAGGVGVVGLITGGVTGGLAMHEHAILVGDCPRNRCPSDRRSTLDNFRTLATVSTIAFVVGGVGVAAGVTLFVLAPSQRSTTTGFYLGPGTVGAAGRF